MISFKSIFSRIIFLHVIALVITAIVMPVVLYWFFRWAANDLHDRAMSEQAQLVAHYLVLGADGSWRLDLPPALQDIYSQAVGRYSYAVVDDTSRVLFSSRKDRSPIARHITIGQACRQLGREPGDVVEALNRARAAGPHKLRSLPMVSVS